MDFWKKYFTKTASDKDEASSPTDSADTAVSSLTRTTSKIMISQDDGDEKSVERLSSRKRPISSVDYAIGKRDNQYSYSLSPTTTTTTTSRIPVPPLASLPPTHSSTFPKPIPKPRIPQYPSLSSCRLYPFVIFPLLPTISFPPLHTTFKSLPMHPILIVMSRSQYILSHHTFIFPFSGFTTISLISILNFHLSPRTAYAAVHFAFNNIGVQVE
jgi:hypothetical protein